MKHMNVPGNLVLCLVLLSVIVSPSCGKKAADMKPVTIVTFFMGDVTITSPGTTPRLASIGDDLKVNDILATGEDSEAVVQIGKDIVINVLSDSRVTFESLLETATTQIRLEKGKVLNKLGKLQRGRGYIIMANTFTAAVRGTTFLVFYEKDAGTVAVGEGKVEVAHLVTNEKKELEKDFAVEITGKRMLESMKRPVSEVESLYLKKIMQQPVIEDPETRTRAEIEQTRSKVALDNKEINNRINEYYPQSMEKIKKNYDRIDEIKLFSGKVYRGIIVERGEKVLIMSTPEGRLEIPVKQVKYTGLAK